jgi:hypothetical protein
LFHIFQSFISFYMYFRTLSQFLKNLNQKEKRKTSRTVMGRPFGPSLTGLAWPSRKKQPTCRHRVRAPGALMARSPCPVRARDGTVAALVGGVVVLGW